MRDHEKVQGERLRSLMAQIDIDSTQKEVVGAVDNNIMTMNWIFYLGS